MSVGLVANNYTIVNPNNLQEANINYINSIIGCDHDVSISTQYTNISALPANVVPVAGLVNSSLSYLQTQINNMVIPANISTINNIAPNIYNISGLVGPQVVVPVKVKLY